MLARECRANTMREAATEGGMNQLFAALAEKLDAKFQELLAKPPVPASNVPSDTPTGGIYLFSEGDVHLYAGRTKRAIRDRIRNQIGANPSAASFPWLIAREATGRKATYKKIGSRDDLLADPTFRAAYDGAKARIARWTCDTCTSRNRYGKLSWRSTWPLLPRRDTTTSILTDTR